MKNPNLFLLLLLTIYSCTPKKEKEPEKVDEVTSIEGAWSSESELLNIHEKEFEYSFALGSDNEGKFTCEIVELNLETGFMAGKVVKAFQLGGDVTMAYEGEFSIFYLSDIKTDEMMVDGPEGALISNSSDIHRNDEAEHQFVLFRKD